LIENSFQYLKNKESKTKIRQSSALSKKSEQGYGKSKTFDSNKIQENIMHVKHGNTYILNSTNIDNTTEFGNNLQNPPFIGKN